MDTLMKKAVGHVKFLSLLRLRLNYIAQKNVEVKPLIISGLTVYQSKMFAPCTYIKTTVVTFVTARVF